MTNREARPYSATQWAWEERSSTAFEEQEIFSYVDGDRTRLYEANFSLGLV